MGKKRTNPHKLPIFFTKEEREKLVNEASVASLYYAWLLVLPVLLENERMGINQVADIWDSANNYAIDPANRGEALISNILNRNKTLLDRLFSSFMPESSGEMSDEGLRDWGNRSGFPKTISLTTLAELYDSKLFAQEPWSGELNYKENVDENNAFDMIMLTKAQTGNIEANLDDTRRKLLTNALNYYINCNADDTDDTDKEDDHE